MSLGPRGSWSTSVSVLRGLSHLDVLLLVHDDVGAAAELVRRRSDTDRSVHWLPSDDRGLRRRGDVRTRGLPCTQGSRYHQLRRLLRLRRYGVSLRAGARVLNQDDFRFLLRVSARAWCLDLRLSLRADDSSSTGRRLACPLRHDLHQAACLLPLPLARLDGPRGLLRCSLRLPRRAVAAVPGRSPQILRSLSNQYMLLRLAASRLPTLRLLVQLLWYILAVVAAGVTGLLGRGAWLVLEDLRLEMWLNCRLS